MASAHDARISARMQAQAQGWESYSGTNGGEFWCCPEHTNTAAEQFFYEHGPWSWIPGTQTEEEGHTASARLYARAERRAKDYGWDLEYLPDADLPGTFLAILYGSDGTELSRQGGVEDTDITSQRVHLAVLALDALSPDADAPDPL
jgi:hypothetical protein